MSDIARDLGVLLDCHFNMTKHIKQVVLLLEEHLPHYQCTDPEGDRTLLHAFIATRLNYCNGLMYGLPRQTISQLQSAKNLAARLITRTRKFDHISPVLWQPHLLPVPQRTIFKILILTYRTLHGLTPNYVTERLTEAQCIYVFCGRKLADCAAVKTQIMW